jgi:hypothetical protein
MTHDKMIEVIAHHKNGGEIECRLKADVTWKDAPSPWWDFGEFDYRAKPEPMVIYIVYQNNVKVGVYERKDNAEYYVKENGLSATIKKFVEVTE